MNIEELIKKSGTTNPVAKGSTKAAQKMLRKSEKLIYALNANVEIKNDGEENFKNRNTLFGGSLQLKNVLNGVVVITSERVLFVNSTLGSVNSKEMSISEIRSIDDTQSFTGVGELRIKGMTEMFCIKIPKKHLFQDIKDALAEAKKSDTEPISNKSSLSIADEIKKYKELLDLGAITQEEYEGKKKQLLNL